MVEEKETRCDLSGVTLLCLRVTSTSHGVTTSLPLAVPVAQVTPTRSPVPVTRTRTNFVRLKLHLQASKSCQLRHLGLSLVPSMVLHRRSTKLSALDHPVVQYGKNGYRIYLVSTIRRTSFHTDGNSLLISHSSSLVHDL